jgi:2'-5' RNA ligase
MRAFIAITPDDRTLTAIVEVQQHCRAAVETITPAPRVNWARRDALHLTVRFFAEIEDDLAMALCDGVATQMPDEASIDIPMARVGGFPRLAAPRVLWIGPPDGWMDSPEGTRLNRIARAIDRACDSLGLPAEDRRWSPHITLARVKDGERSVGNGVRQMEPPSSGLPLHADRVSFYKSDLGPAGVRHTVLWTVPVSTSRRTVRIADSQ